MEAPDTSFRVYGWNLGGVEASDLPKAIQNGTGASLRKKDIVLVQEFPRVKAGWSTEPVGSLKVLTFRPEGMWRGTGVAFDSSTWNVVSKKSSMRGVWVHLRHLESAESVWFSTAHFSPGITQELYEAEVENHFRAKPRQCRALVFQGDLNCSFRWWRDKERVEASGKDGKADLFVRYASEAGLDFVPFEDCQWTTPTSRPRQQGRAGTQIDYMLSLGVRKGHCQIHVDSSMCIGSDHDCVSAELLLKTPRVIKRCATGPREWTGFVGVIDHMDQQRIEQLALQCSRPRRTDAYRDPHEVKQAFKQAKLLKTGVAWKHALHLRKQARKAWEAARLERASKGDWKALRSCRPRRNAGWDVTFAAAQQGDPHEAVHQHLAGVYQGEPPSAHEFKYTGEVRAFTMQEMREALSMLKSQKAVGSDYTSRELLVGVMGVPGGEEHMLEWFNRLLVEQVVPKAWNEPLLVLLPKVEGPTRCKQLRPLAMGSSVGKLFARMLLSRTARFLSPRTPAQCAAPGRQTADFLFSIHRVFELSREWGSPLCALKVDLHKAFDCVDRRQLLLKLGERMGPCAEMGCWAALMSEVTGFLQTPWGSSLLSMPAGIKQGAIESPSMFGFIAETALEETRVLHRWDEHAKLLEGLNEEECVYMDDGCFWSRGVKLMQTKVEAYAKQLSKYGLSINLGKCQLYCAPRCPGGRSLRLDDVVLEASPHLEVMGLQFKVGVTVMELITPLATKARDRFWEIKHVLCSKGELSKRIRTMQRTAAQAGLWCLSALPPDPGGLGYLNSVQIQLIVWMMRLRKGAQEDWGAFRLRVWRAARAALHRAGEERWSTVWLRKYWRFSGHRARGLDRESPVLSSILDSFRNKQWWEAEKQKPKGVGLRHVRHFAKLMQMEGRLDFVAGGPWRCLARDRKAWADREQAWVEREDLPWASGRQPSLEG